MSESTRDRINAAFDEELRSAPVPAGLRPLAIRDAVTAPRAHPNRPLVLAAIAAVLDLSVVATLVLGSDLLRSRPTPAGSTTPPAPRAGAAVAYDGQHGVLIVFGGVTGRTTVTAAGDTWTWDGRSWRHLRPATSPAPRQFAVMAYDEARHDLVLFGGEVWRPTNTGPWQPVNDTWTWDGSDWKQMHPAHQPSFNSDGGPSTMLYDPISRTVLFYGFPSDPGGGVTARAQTWAWNGTDWSQIGAGSGPTDASPPAGTLVADGDHVLLLPGSSALVGGRQVTQTWEWNGSSWALLHPALDLPGAIGIAGGAYDPDTHQLVLLTSDTWLWDGTTWSRAHPSVQPPAAGYTAYMPSLHEVVTWNDVTSSLDYGLYGWNGTDWKVIVPGTDNPLNVGGKGYLGVMTPDQAAAAVRAEVTGAHPVLLPTAIPAGWDATVNLYPDGFTILYQSDLRDKSITFGITEANPPSGGAKAKDTPVRFRHGLALKFRPAGYAEYYVYDTTDRTSYRWLMWSEPGAVTDVQPVQQGVPYYLAAEGLTDAQFWQVANSLR